MQAATTRKPKSRAADERPRAAPFVFRGERYLVVSHALEPRALSASLTPSEVQIVRELLLGKTYLEIATRRKRSRNTVANQVASILRKLRVGSRRELALLVRGVNERR